MILVTGGAGYIGSHCVKILTDLNYEVVTIDNLSKGHEEALKSSKTKLYKGDISDNELLDKIFSENKNIDGVMHFAAFTSVGESIENPDKYYTNNYKNTLNIIKAMKLNDVDKFIFSSTAAVYGNPENIPITEKHPLNPINPYGKSKLLVENTLLKESILSGLKYISLRYFNASGADLECEIGENHDPETHLIPLILDVAIEKRDKIAIFGDDYNTPDGTCIRDYIHVCDLAQAHVKAFKYLQESEDNYTKNNINENNIFNLGNGNGFSVKEVIDMCEKVTNKEITREITSRREGDPAILIADSKKIKDVLKWNPIYDDLEIIIKTAWKWHKKLNNKT